MDKSPAAVAYVLHHVVLPPQLPQAQDHHPAFDRMLIDLALDSLQYMKTVVSDEHNATMDAATDLISNMMQCRNEQGHLDEVSLGNVLKDMAASSDEQSVALQIAAQNAGVLIRRQANSLIFELFELTPTNEAAMVKGRLIRTFPGFAAAIPVERISEPDLRQSLGDTLTKMTSQIAEAFQPTTSRNTPHPGLVTDFFLNVVAALGSPTDVVRILKHTREDVLRRDSKQPWRRSSLWLLLRVTLQLLFTRMGAELKVPDELYKIFMVVFLERILGLVSKHWSSLGSEAIQFVSAKLVRRLRKLETLNAHIFTQARWAHRVKASMSRAHEFIQLKWTAIQQATTANVDTTMLRDLQPDNDLDASLPCLNDFLAKIQLRITNQSSSASAPTGTFPLYSCSKIPSGFKGSDESIYFRLGAVEKWVEENLCDWSKEHLGSLEACGELFGLIKEYHIAASAAYVDIPVSLSIMFLTILELWVSSDMLACLEYPLLQEYDPEIRLHEFQGLCLPLKRQLERFHEVEVYFQVRQSKAVKGNPSVYRDFGHERSFAVRYFDQTPALQALHAEILRKATRDQQLKREELAELQTRYALLMADYHQMECDSEIVTVDDTGNPYPTARHISKNCAKCAYKKKAKALYIVVHEWPLHRDLSTAKATIFELKAPQLFCDWRDMSYYFTANIMEFRTATPERIRGGAAVWTLGMHPELGNMLAAKSHERRIRLQSEKKSASGTTKKNIPDLDVDQVCVKSNLEYRLFDTIGRMYTAELLSAGKTTIKLLYKMPRASKCLEKFMYKPPTAPDGPSTNEPLASLADCPDHFSVDEFKAFGVTPLGQHIVYANILTQLAMPSLDFSKTETQTLILQSIHQAGPGNERIERATHNVLVDASLGDTMIHLLHTSLRHRSENWESWRSAASFSLLARRIMSLTSSPAIVKRCHEFLQVVRQTCVEWLRRLKQRLASSTEEDQQNDIRLKSTEVALLCVNTFDVEEAEFDQLLEEPTAVTTLMQCSIKIRESLGTKKKSSEGLHDVMIQAWRSLMFRLFPKLVECIRADGRILDEAILDSWAAFQPTNDMSWASLSGNSKHWLGTISGNLKVYLNLLTAELLIDGRSLSILPAQYTQHPAYIRLFNKSMLDIGPTNVPGLSYSAKALYRGFEVHLGISLENDLLIVALHENSRFDLLPPRLFEDQMPQAFVTDFTHWFDHRNHEVLFCPVDAPWPCETAELWHLRHEDDSYNWRLSRGTNVLVHRTSGTARALSGLFQALEDEKHVHVTLETISQTVSIELPRLQLGFYVGQTGGRIYSRQYRGMILDSDQSTGSLIGLSSKLTLRNERAATDRMIVVPAPRDFSRETVTYSKVPSLHCVRVSIIKDNATRVYAYSLDTMLGRELHDQSIQSQLVLSLLHALTSHCLPDPLTRKCGTEAAIDILRSAALRSFETLSEENVSILNLIGSLSVTRTYVLQDENGIQEVVWDPDLYVGSQDPQLRKAVQSILHQAQATKVFYPDNIPVLDIDRQPWKPSNIDLEEREAIRNSTFQVSGYGSDGFTATSDLPYRSRDREVGSDKSRRAFVACELIIRKDAALHVAVPDLRSAMLSTHFDHGIVKGCNGFYNEALLQYDKMWLGAASPLLKDHWCGLHEYLTSSSTSRSPFAIMVWLATMAYGEDAEMLSIQSLAAFFRLREQVATKMPPALAFSLSEGRIPNLRTLQSIMKLHTRRYTECPEGQLPLLPGETVQQHGHRVRQLVRQKQESACLKLIDHFIDKFPTDKPPAIKSGDVIPYFDMVPLMKSVTEKFRLWNANRRFYEYMGRTSKVMARQNISYITAPCFVSDPPTRGTLVGEDARYFNAAYIFDVDAPPLAHDTPSVPGSSLPPRPVQPNIAIKEHTPHNDSSNVQKDLKSLCRLLDPIAKSAYEKDYVKALRKSCVALQIYCENSKIQSCRLDDNTAAILQQYSIDCQAYFETLTTALSQVASRETGFSNGVAFSVGYSPRISPTFWLRYLLQERFDLLSASWKSIILQYGLSITHMHRAQRLVALSENPAELAEQLQLKGHSNWDVSKFPETLLLEAENGILIREVQEVIAAEMRSPTDKNAVMQLNMGSGKSSVILPMVAAALSHSDNLVRVIVARPQSKQMLEMLIAKLGGLLDRRILHMPFARRLKISKLEAETILQMCKDCVAEKGVLLIQPEHILSLRLLAIEHSILNTDVAESIRDLQQFLYTTSRDIVDESDHQFDCKLELIYTMGFQQPVDLAPSRWFIISDILALVTEFCHDVKNKLPCAIEVLSSNNGAVPKIRILRRDGADELLTLIATHVVQHGLLGLPTRSQSPGMQECIQRYISEPHLDREDIRAVEESLFWTDSTKDALMLLRGLLAGGILRHVLSSKRWRVNYGADTHRVPSTSLAVPYRYKDGPSARAEFSHPDVLITLTLLSHYYSGLNDQQLFDTFRHLLKSDRAAIEYDAWVRTGDPTIPEAFKNLSGVNIRDRTLCIQQLFPYVRFSRACINFFLSRLVFPKEVRQFEKKISASAWNLGANMRSTTGFSGTSDTQHLLPLAIKHLDLESQRHTNALVLGHVLSSTQLCDLPERPHGVDDATHLLEVVTQMKPDVRVILDCGAQILQKDNEEVVRIWLQMTDSTQISAAVFFHEEELVVLDRGGRIESFRTSPFSRKLDVCIVFLDDAHTRGTDLKLPRDFRAAVTLGAGVTRDRLMQACMRMRLLGQGQEVVFIISEEMATKIRGKASKPEELEIEVEDVLCWAISESWAELKKLIPIWSSQGARYLSREHLMRDVAPTREEAAGFLELEAQTIEDRYKPQPFNKDPLVQFRDWDKNNSDLQEIIKRCKDFNAMGFMSEDLEEEEERELAPEKEEERQVEQPARMVAVNPVIHPEVERLAETGTFSKTSRVIVPAFLALALTSIGKQYDLHEFPTDLLVTEDYMRTIQIPDKSFDNPYLTDAFQRPVQWVVSVPGQSNTMTNLVVISPFEANYLQLKIQKHMRVTLHTFAPRIIANFEALDNLDLWTVGRDFNASSVPRSLIIQLNLFAGSLYLRSYDEYIELCDTLGLLRTNAQEQQIALPDGFITTSKGKWGLRSSPVPMLRALLLRIRREGEGLEKTHLGKILNGGRLEQSDFDIQMTC
ncbi:hypothetical protein NX059_012324 [Plenodomus lindquistii]|nr:hypothetical protein NX059_012324 [Plenodomus lindquistii]